MGTSGLFGFYHKGKYYPIYNGKDSYPGSLGSTVVAFLEKGLKEGKLDEWMLALENIVVIDEKVKPTANDIESLKPYTNIEVSSRSTDDWYCLIWGCQSTLQQILDSGYYLPILGVGCDPFVEWIYVIDLDNNQFKVKYMGNETSYSFDDLPAYY